MKQRQWKREKFLQNSFKACDATWIDHIKTHSWMSHRGGHPWGWEVWWGWVSKRRPFQVILRGTHPMCPKSPGSSASSYIENMHEKPRRWYTMWSGKVSKTHLISHLLVLGFAIPAALLAIFLLGESAPLTSSSVLGAICTEDEREEGEPMRD